MSRPDRVEKKVKGKIGGGQCASSAGADLAEDRDGWSVKECRGKEER